MKIFFAIISIFIYSVCSEGGSSFVVKALIDGQEYRGGRYWFEQYPECSVLFQNFGYNCTREINGGWSDKQLPFDFSESWKFSTTTIIKDVSVLKTIQFDTFELSGSNDQACQCYLKRDKNKYLLGYKRNFY